MRESDFVTSAELRHALERLSRGTEAEMQRVTDLNAKLFGEITEAISMLANNALASTMVCAIVSKICVERFGLNPDALLESVAEHTSDANIVALARAMLGGRPTLTLIKGGLDVGDTPD